MMSPSLLLLVALLLILGFKAKQRDDGSLERAYERFKQQIAQFLPRMILVVIGTGFLLQIIPSELISTHLGKDAGWVPILYGGFAGMLVPGPAVAFTLLRPGGIGRGSGGFGSIHYRLVYIRDS